jgi:hypothetical protein
MISLGSLKTPLFRVSFDSGGRNPDIGTLFVDAELCEKSRSRLPFAFDDFVKIGPVVAGTLGEFSHAAHLLRHNAEKFEDLRSRKAMDCDWGVCHVFDSMRALAA